jgi:serine/threonine-protein kinase
MALFAGLRVTNNVALVRPLGSGGVGTVWVGQHETLRTEVAVKFVHAGIAKQSPVTVARFKREASIAAQIKSPHVVHMLDHGVLDDGTPFLIMELLEGENLEERLARSRRLSLTETTTLLGQTAKALGKAHELGIVHRDLKPANLFLVDGGYDIFVKVLDFGIAKDFSLDASLELTSSGSVAGTPHYMSPEQLVSTKDVNYATDVWAIGVIVYEALTGVLPFDGESIPDIAQAVFAASPVPATQRVSLPPTVDRWFKRCFNHDPALRFESVAEMAEAFTLATRMLPRMAIADTLIGDSDAASDNEPTAVIASQEPKTPVRPGKRVTSDTMTSVGAAPPAPALPFAPAATLSDASSSAILPSSVTLASLGDEARATRGRRSTIVMGAGAVLLLVVIAGTVLLARDGAAPSPGANPSASSLVATSSATAAPPAPRAPVTSAPASSSSHAPERPAGTAPPKTALRPLPPPPAPAPAASAPAANCQGDNAFVRDASGGLRVRPECL